MNHLHLSLFGTFEARVNGTPLPFRSEKIRALLAYLALNPTAQRRETLAALLWGNFPEQRAQRNLALSLTRLRDTLAPLLAETPTLLSSTSDAVWLRLDDTHHQVDVLRFDQLMAACRVHPHESPERCPACLERLAEGVALYRGDLLAGFTLPDSPEFAEWQQRQQDRRQEQVLGGLTTLTERALLTGELAHAQELAQHQLSLQPWREEAYRQMMRALVQDGQSGAALARYQECCRVLAELLGTAPEAATTALYEQIRNRRERQQTAHKAVHNLPPPLAPLLGREAELAQLVTLLTEPTSRWVTVVGLGGTGKSVLALAAARTLAGHFEDGVFWVPLAEHEGRAAPASESLLDALVRVLQEVGLLAKDYLPSTLARLGQVLHGKHCLLLLDGLDSLQEAAPLLSELLRRAPQLALLVTVRSRLGLRSEQVVELSGLAVPPRVSLAGDAVLSLEHYGAVQLFVQAARRVVVDFSLEPASTPAVARLCQAVGGLPLALELAAAWVRLLSCTEIAWRIEEQLAFLTTTSRDVPTRQRSLHGIFDASWQRLSSAARQRLATLSVFAGPFSYEALTAIANDAEPLAGPSDITVTGELVDQGLLTHLPPDGYDLHPLLRHYAREKLAEQGRLVQGQARHSSYYAAWLHAHPVRGSHEAHHAQQLRAALENLYAAWTWAVEQEHLARVEQMVEGLYRLFDYEGQWQEGESLFRQATVRLFGQEMPAPGALAQAERYPDPLQAGRLHARLLACWAVCTWHLGRPAAAQALLQASVALAAQVSAPSLRAFALFHLGLLQATRTVPTGQRAVEEALDLYHRLDDVEGRARALYGLGVMAEASGRWEEAQRQYQESLSLARAMGSERGVALALHRMGQVAWAMDSPDLAYQYLRESLAAARRSASPQVEAEVLVGLIEPSGVLRGYSRAHDRFKRCLALLDAQGDPLLLALAYLHLGRSAIHHGKWPPAQRYLAEALVRLRQLDHALALAATLTALAEVAWVRGEGMAARLHGQEALQYAHTSGALPLLAEALLGWTHHLVESGACEQAAMLLVGLQAHPASPCLVRRRTTQRLDELAELGVATPAPATSAMDLAGIANALLTALFMDEEDFPIPLEY